ncbi:MAG: hypothetical protein ACJAR4_001491 [Psychroserpens sp.]|jgi:hypothetical protein
MKIVKYRYTNKKNKFRLLSKVGCYILFLISISTFSCGNSDDDPIPTYRETELTNLNESQNTITINWRLSDPTDFVSYQIYRLESHTSALGSSNTIKTQGELIKTITSNQQISYTDNEIRYNVYVNYMVVSVYENSETGLFEEYNSINYLYFERPELIFDVLSAQKLNSGEIKIIWEIDSNEGFENYKIFSFDHNSPIESSALVAENGSVLDEISVQSQGELIDYNSYTNAKINYSVAKIINGKSIYSRNTISIDNPNSVNFRPFTSLKNPLKTNEIIIFGNEGDILFFETSNYEISEKIELNKRIYQPLIENYNGVLSLYVPSQFGKIFIYDLLNYSLVDEINLSTNREIISLIIKENYLIFLESLATNQYSNISYLNFDDNTISRNPGIITKSTKLFNSQNEFFFRLEPSYNGNQNDSSLHRYDLIDGELVFSNGVDNGSIKSGDIFALSPDFNFFVSTAYGFHLNIDYNDMSENNLGNYGLQMSFDGINYVGSQDKYSDIKISTDNKVFLSIEDLKKLVSYQAFTFQNSIESFDTKGYPLLFELLPNNKIIVINKSINSNNFFIEKISIN